MLNATLASVLRLVKAKLRISLATNVGTADDLSLYTLIDLKQRELAGEHEFPFMKLTASVAITAGTRYFTLPTTIDMLHQVKAEVIWNGQYFPLAFGIGSEEYNTFSSGDASTADQTAPITRWDFHGSTQFEVWPISSEATSILFTGQKIPTAFTTDYAAPSTDKVDLDDMLVAYFVAGERAAKDGSADATVILSEAVARLNSLKGKARKRDTSYRIGEGGQNPPRVKPIPVVVA